MNTHTSTHLSHLCDEEALNVSKFVLLHSGKKNYLFCLSQVLVSALGILFFGWGVLWPAESLFVACRI